MISFDDHALRAVLVDTFPAGIDDSILEYFLSILHEGDAKPDEEYLIENIAPFIESYGLVPEGDSIEGVCKKLSSALTAITLKTSQSNERGNSHNDSDEPQLLKKSIQLSDVAKNILSEHEQAAVNQMWGFDKIRTKRNDTFEPTEAASSKYERKAQKEQRKFIDDLDLKLSLDDGGGHAIIEGEADTQISTMLLPDFSGNSREKDIHVQNFNITFGGQILLDGADLRIVYGKQFIFMSELKAFSLKD
jgi:hypothetical protein